MTDNTTSRRGDDVRAEADRISWHMMKSAGYLLDHADALDRTPDGVTVAQHIDNLTAEVAALRAATADAREPTDAR